MQTANVNVPVRVTGRHLTIKEPTRAYVLDKIDHIHLDYPRIIDAQVILEVTKHRHCAEVILHCSNHITIQADAECDDLLAAIDAAVAKIAAQMRKYKTKMLRTHRPRKQKAGHIDEHVLHLDESFGKQEESEPRHIHTEKLSVKPLFVDEAALQLEMSGAREFIVFLNAKTEKLNLLHRRKDASFGLIELAAP